MTYPPPIDIANAKKNLGRMIRETPVWRWDGPLLERLVGGDVAVYLKLELFQVTGSFKPRGALSVMQAMSSDALSQGVSAGNHAAAVAYAASALKTSAKVLMPETASPARIRLCQTYGAEVVLVENIGVAFERAKEVEAREGRTLVHPFDGPLTALGTATVGLEFMTQVADLDYVVVPIGGGGLCAGISCAVKQINPACQVIAVEPFGADTMSRSFASGKPEAIERVDTIADSLGAPYALEYSFGLCRQFVDEICRVDDTELCRAMYVLFSEMKLAVEPAGAAATAALLGPLRDRVRGKRVGLLVCGSNIDAQRFTTYVHRGEAA